MMAGHGGTGDNLHPWHKAPVGKGAMAGVEGPEKPTLIERVVMLVPGPYVVGCLVMSVVFGVPGMLLTRYLDTFSVDRALSIFGPLEWQNVATYSFANFVLTFYALYGIRYMRTKIAATEPHMGRLAPDGERTLHRVFKPISDSLPSTVVGSIILLVSFLSFPGQANDTTLFTNLVVRAIGYLVNYLTFGTFIWVYVGSIVGLRRLGREPLRFISYFEDGHLGVRFFGSISLSLVLVYFVGIGLVFFSFISVPSLLFMTLVGLIILGIVLFFLPLFTIHARMIEEKQRAREAMAAKFSDLIAVFEQSGGYAGRETPVETSTLLAYQVMERKVSSIAEWPLDSRTLSWFSAIVLSVVAAIVTRYVLVYLGI